MIPTLLARAIVIVAIAVNVAGGLLLARHARRSDTRQHGAGRGLRRVLAVGLTLGLVGLGTLALAQPAGAADLPSLPDLPGLPDCPPGVPDSKVPPVPSPPNPYLASMFGITEPGTPPAGDPFVDGSPVAITDIYGYGGLDFHTYDLGCGGALADPVAGLWTGAANLTTAATTVVVQTVSTLVWAIEQPGLWTSVFDPILESVAATVKANPFATLFPATLLVVGMIMLARAHRAELASVTRDAAWVLFVIAVSVFFLTAPARAAHTLDDGLGFAVREFRAGTAGNGGPLTSVGQVHRVALYDTWAAGTFGDSGSATAKKYGPELFKASTFSWAEWRTAQSDPQAYDHMRAAKQQQWMDIAKAIEDEDPEAYLNLQGKRPLNRVLHAGVGAITAVATCSFVIAAAVLFIAALVVIRLFVLAWPLWALLGAVPSKRHVLGDLWNKLTGLVLSALIFAFAAGLMSLLIGALLRAQVPLALRVLLAAIATIAAWTYLARKPLRTGLRAFTEIAKILLIRQAAASGVQAGIEGAAAAGPAGAGPVLPAEAFTAPLALGSGPQARALGAGPIVMGPEGGPGAGPPPALGPGIIPMGPSPSSPASPAALPAIDTVPLVASNGDEVFVPELRTETRHRPVNPIPSRSTAVATASPVTAVPGAAGGRTWAATARPVVDLPPDPYGPASTVTDTSGGSLRRIPEGAPITVGENTTGRVWFVRPNRLLPEHQTDVGVQMNGEHERLYTINNDSVVVAEDDGRYTVTWLDDDEG
jgi:hypothetical protein